MKKQLIIVFLFSILIIAGCGSTDNNDISTNTDENEDVKNLIATYSGDKTASQSVSVTGTQLIITEENGEEIVHSLPDDEFFVSIAPFKTETHPCTFHSLTGCQGELDSESFDVLIEDSKGNIVIEDSMKTGANGFIDMWLPRHDTFSVTITQGNKQTTAEISTDDDSPTCITTMQLS